MTTDALVAPIRGAERREVGGAQVEVAHAFEFKAPQVVAIEPGHDGWVVGEEPAVLIEFEFERETVRRLGLPETHTHAG